MKQNQLNQTTHYHQNKRIFNIIALARIYFLSLQNNQSATQKKDFYNMITNKSPLICHPPLTLLLGSCTRNQGLGKTNLSRIRDIRSYLYYFTKAMKKITILTILLSIAFLQACAPKYKWKEPDWHKYAINEYCIPSEVIISSLNSKTEDTKLLWHCTFKSPDELRIKKDRNKVLFEKIAREHGETGQGFYDFPRYVSCLYQVEKIEVVGFHNDTETLLSPRFSYLYQSLELFIKSGYKEGRGDNWAKGNLGEIGKIDFLDIDEGLTISCPKGEIEGEFERLEMRVTLKDGKVIRSDMPI